MSEVTQSRGHASVAHMELRMSAPRLDDLSRALEQAQSDASIAGILLHFRDDAAECTTQDDTLGQAIHALQVNIERSAKPVVAVLWSNLSGPAAEIALTAHGRATTLAREITVENAQAGALPRFGAMRRLPRLVGAPKALEMMVLGSSTRAGDPSLQQLFDCVSADQQLAVAAQSLALSLGRADRTPAAQPTSDDRARLTEAIQAFRATHARKIRGQELPNILFAALKHASSNSDSAAAATARDAAELAKDHPQAKALRYAAAAERQAHIIPDIRSDLPLRAIASAGVIGAGTMGGGIAMVLANAGISVTLVERDPAALERGLGIIRQNYDRTARRGGLTGAEVDERMSRIRGALELSALADVDLVIEAIFEDMAAKTSVFQALDAICRPGAILATNTSGLNINQIAAATSRAQDVIGLHFFSPANVMKLLEVVRAEHTAADVIATAMAMSTRLRKVAALVGVCKGFVGNRILRSANTKLSNSCSRA